MVAPNAVAEAPRYGGTWVVAISGDPPTLNPAIGTAYPTSTVVGQVFNALVDHDVNGDAIPDLAKSWTVSDDGLTYTFNLVNNAKWHDGEPFTSADIKFCWEEITLKYQPLQGKLTSVIKSIETPDDYTVVFNLNHAYGAFMIYAGKFGGMMLPKHLYEGTDILNNPYNHEPVGTGSMIFKEWVKGDHVTVERNPHYFREGLPYLDKIIYQIIPSEATRVSAYEAGEVDVLTPFFLYNEISRLNDMPNTLAFEAAKANGLMEHMVVNLRNPYLGNLKVRQAISYALDRDAMVEIGFSGQSKVSKNIMNDGVPWAYNSLVKDYSRDIAMANQLLDEAGFPKGSDGIRFSISISYDLGFSSDVAIAEVARSSLKDVGIDLKLKGQEAGTYYERVGEWDYDLAILVASTAPDPIALLGRFVESSAIGKGAYGYRNTMGYNNSQVDELFELARTAPTQEKAGGYLKAVQVILMEELPIIPTTQFPEFIVWRSTFHDFPEGLIFVLQHTLDHVWWEGGTLLTTTVAPTTVTTTATTSIAPVTVTTTATTTAMEAAPPAALFSTEAIITIGAVIIIMGIIGAVGYRRSKAKS